MTHNAKVASSAAKGHGTLLQQLRQSLTKLLAKAEGKDGVDTAAVALCNEKLDYDHSLGPAVSCGSECSRKEQRSGGPKRHRNALKTCRLIHRIFVRP